ncbi:synaptotagmin 7 [Elysia marginata]|uniref:Synaptotagmin 7 n=1 Tax=Elysia marginata TaxID=1093978 RepID=A0AAV4JXL6_9GAST|nr:synaptotagmin 7 [Elysia marginata]
MSLTHVVSRPPRFERPDKRMVAEHVQPSPGSQTSLNQQLAMRDSSPLSYQAMGITRITSAMKANIPDIVPLAEVTVT